MRDTMNLYFKLWNNDCQRQIPAIEDLAIGFDYIIRFSFGLRSGTCWWEICSSFHATDT